jgi:hypothetical protein
MVAYFGTSGQVATERPSPNHWRALVLGRLDASRPLEMVNLSPGRLCPGLFFARNRWQFVASPTMERLVRALNRNGVHNLGSCRP